MQTRVDQGWKQIRVQIGGYGGNNQAMHLPKDNTPGVYYDPDVYMKTMIEGFEKLRENLETRSSFVMMCMNAYLPVKR